MVPAPVADLYRRVKTQIKLVRSDRGGDEGLAVGWRRIGGRKQSAKHVTRVPAAGAGRIIEVEVTYHHAVGECRKLGRRLLERSQHPRRGLAADAARDYTRDPAGLRVECAERT